MRDIPFDEVINAHTAFLTAHHKEFRPLIRLLLLAGDGSASLAQTAADMHWPRSQARVFIGAAGLEIDADERVHLVPGAGCALDTILLPMLLGHSAPVRAMCPATGREIRLTVHPNGIEGVNPPETMLSLIVPGQDTAAGTVAETICAYGHFFANRAHAAAWPELHPDAILLTVAEAAQLAHVIAEAARHIATTHAPQV